MLSLICFFFITFLVSSILMLIASFISKKIIFDREKTSPFECGFDPKGTARLPFSLRFFLIALIFLIFDVEITLLLPLPIILSYSNISSWTLTSTVFLLILLLGLFHEWNQGALDWSH
uniref:NADH dehydrogenase subunit 3 n=1 Tax=Paranaspides williamsi TaxID=2231316 RepID=UPI002A824506|nr:NADH dehydrogenase subunit 3 [Paranaspides williamsi]WOR81141.1 NADH dehydrogenase subunit 3 [Paranaspides williamsi]